MAVDFCETLVMPETEEALELGTVVPDTDDNAEMSIFESRRGHRLFL